MYLGSHARYRKSKKLEEKVFPMNIGGGRVGPGRAMPDQEYGPEIINDVILSLILITIN